MSLPDSMFQTDSYLSELPSGAPLASGVNDDVLARERALDRRRIGSGQL
jgi:hypothetical protein